jgi:gas vesicle protein
MRFILGMLIGFGIGFAGAVLFAPEKKKAAVHWAEGRPAAPSLSNGSSDLSGNFQHLWRSLRDRVNNAWEEAKRASEEAEQELRERYEREVRARGAGKK